MLAEKHAQGPQMAIYRKISTSRQDDYKSPYVMQ